MRGLNGADAFRQARDFARGCLFMHQTFLTGTRNNRLGGTQGGFGRCFIATSNGLIDATDERPHSGFLVAVTCRAALNFAHHFFG